MKTLLEILRLSENYLKERGIERPRREAEDLMAYILESRRLDLYLQFERPITEKELTALREVLKRRAKGEPFSYITGKVTFFGVNCTVTPAVLIPRPETELLVEKVIRNLEPLDLNGKVLWDVCCGSGCIGLALKKRFPQLHVVLSDYSEEALAVAQKNAADLGQGFEVEFLQGDLFAPFSGKSCDFFISNPPYITEAEYAQLSREVLNEPKIALVSGPHGTEFYSRIAQELSTYLNPGGRGWLELGTGQGASVKNIFESKGWSCQFECDYAGHDRFFFLEKV